MDYPEGTADYALRAIDGMIAVARAKGTHVGQYAERVLGGVDEERAKRRPCCDSPMRLNDGTAPPPTIERTRCSATRRSSGSRSSRERDDHLAKRRASSNALHSAATLGRSHSWLKSAPRPFAASIAFLLFIPSEYVTVRFVAQRTPRRTQGA